MSTLKNISPGPLDLATGQTLDRLEVAKKVDITDHERRLIDQGLLLVIDARGRDTSSSVKNPDEKQEG